MIPLAVVAQGASLISSFIGSSGPSSVQVQLEILNQLNEINANITRQNQILADISRKIDQIPEKQALFSAKIAATDVETDINKIFLALRPDGIQVTDPNSHFADLVSQYDIVERAFGNIVSVLRHTKSIDHSLVELSYPIISICHNYLMLSRLMCFPALLAQYMNKGTAKLQTEFNPRVRMH